MRARELFENNRADVPDGARDTMKPSIVAHGLDNAYGFYRALIAIAGMPHTNIPLSSVTPDKPYFAPYTTQELNHVHDILGHMGSSYEHLSKKPSSEPKTVNKVSPVRAFEDLDK
jgi:hypothetical protein